MQRGRRWSGAVGGRFARRRLRLLVPRTARPLVKVASAQGGEASGDELTPPAQEPREHDGEGTQEEEVHTRGSALAKGLHDHAEDLPRAGRLCKLEHQLCGHGKTGCSMLHRHVEDFKAALVKVVSGDLTQLEHSSRRM